MAGTTTSNRLEMLIDLNATNSCLNDRERRDPHLDLVLMILVHSDRVLFDDDDNASTKRKKTSRRGRKIKEEIATKSRREEKK